MYSLFLMIAAGIFKAFLDLSAHGKPFWFMSKIKNDPNYYFQNKYNWWYTGRSSGNKWKNGHDDKDGEKFLGSSTVFVMFTDFWHLAQFFFLNTFILAIVLYEPLINGWADFLIYGVVMKSVFQLCYGRLLVKK